MLSNNLGEKQIFTNSQKTAETTYNYSPEKITITENKGSTSTTTHLDRTNWMTAIGELGEGIFHGAVQGDYYNPSNTAQVIGKFIGQVGTSFVPGIG